jgi:hypothetical protein
MATLATLRSRIADAINRTDLNTQIDRAINKAIEYYYSKEEFWFQETSASFSTIIDQESYDTTDGIPSDIADIELATITITSTNIRRLIKRTFEWIRDTNEGMSGGDPSDYAWYKNKIYFYLIPNTVKTITLYYKKSYAELSGDSDTNDYTSYAQDLIEARARYYIYDEILKDLQSADRSKIAEVDALNALRERSAKFTLFSGKVEATIF